MTTGFLIGWYLSLIALGVVTSERMGSAIGHLDGTWVLQGGVWLGIVILLLTGNLMATGSPFLRGLKDWP